jgi:hypothetical protein
MDEAKPIPTLTSMARSGPHLPFCQIRLAQRSVSGKENTRPGKNIPMLRRTDLTKLSFR